MYKIQGRCICSAPLLSSAIPHHPFFQYPLKHTHFLFPPRKPVLFFVIEIVQDPPVFLLYYKTITGRMSGCFIKDRGRSSVLEECPLSFPVLCRLIPHHTSVSLHLNISGGFFFICSISRCICFFISSDIISDIAVVSFTAASFEEAPQWKMRSFFSP